MQSAAHASDRSMWREETVLWVSDDKTNECSYCQQKFSPFKRKVITDFIRSFNQTHSQTVPCMYVHLHTLTISPPHTHTHTLSPPIPHTTPHTSSHPTTLTHTHTLPQYTQHHCRSCGHIFCHDCSKHKITIDHLGYSSPQRVCDECFRKLHGAHKTTDVGVSILSVN